MSLTPAHALRELESGASTWFLAYGCVALSKHIGLSELWVSHL